MTKVRVYELAKDYGMRGPELAELLRKLGFEKIKSHMAVLDGPDQMMVMARLEAQGLARAPADSGESSGSSGPKTLRKKALPGPQKKSLPPPVLKKKLPTEEDTPPEADTSAPEAAPSEPAAAPTPAAQPPAAPPPAAQPAAPPPAAQPPRAPEPTAPEPAAPTPAPSRSEPVRPPRPAATAPEATTDGGASAAAELQKEPAPKPRVVPAEPRPTTQGAPAPKPTETPASRPAAAATTATPPAAAAPTAAAPPTPGAPQAPAAPGPGGQTPSGRPIKRLLVPKAKAQVVGRIELPQETIRDATRRSAPAGDRESADRKLRRMALERTQSRTASRTGNRRGPARGRGRDPRGGQRKRSGSSPISTIDPNKVVEIQPPISVKNLSEAVGIKVPELLATLAFRLGVKGKTINSFITPDEVELVGIELGRNIKIVEQREAEEELIQSIVKVAEGEDEVSRAPVLTFMGHVDHGKTTLLDALRDSDVVKGEAGGITQHIGAYKITHHSGSEFVVLDTPGHAAFTQMRARGASLTDIVILVVAADDGVMPQTEEAINHALQAKVPIVVAVTKCDRPNANAMQVRQQLSVKGLQPEEWGGNTQVVDVSSVTGEGLDDLVEKIELEAELLELRARPSASGVGLVVESKQTPEQGVVVNVLVTNGTLRVKDRILCGESFSRIRGLTDDHGRQVPEAGPSTPVTIMGIDELPQPGDHVYVVTDVKKAKEVAGDRQRRARDLSLAERTSVTLENLRAHLAAAAAEEIKVILKADVMGSLEPIKTVMADLATDEVRVNIIHSALGGISETDVSLAEASGAVIIGFNSVPDVSARQAADRANVQIKFYDVIYALIDDMKLALEGMLAPEEVEKVTGHAEVRAVFKSSKFGNIAGCYILDGMVSRNQRVRLSRDGTVIWSGSLQGLRRIKDDVREVKAGFECGITFDGYNDVKVGDQIESYAVELVKRKLE
ncbi:MAG: translation initiation factor IF-2 [Planctomycetota bacterium]